MIWDLSRDQDFEIKMDGYSPIDIQLIHDDAIKIVDGPTIGKAVIIGSTLIYDPTQSEGEEIRDITRTSITISYRDHDGGSHRATVHISLLSP